MTTDHAAAQPVVLRGAGGKWLPGRSANPGGRPRALADMRELARQHTPAAIEALVAIATGGANESARVAAATALLDRGWGRPTQPIAGDPDTGPIEISVEERERAIAARRAAAREMLERAFGGAGPADE